MTEATNGSRPLPSWYDGAKLGVMVHWGPYSVPAWAERSGTLQELWSGRGPRYYFKHNPYAEWYTNTIRIAGSGAQRHQLETYGADAAYADFIPAFQEGVQAADVGGWADLFAQAGARYAVFITKHHDGFLLWPSATTPPDSRYVARRDVVGDLTDAVRARGLRMGFYYCSGFDFRFNATVIRDARSAVLAIPNSEAYGRYCDAHFSELIDRYRPSVLWNDIAYCGAMPRDELFARYYEAVPDGVVNDRWSRVRLPANPLARGAITGGLRLVDWLWPLLPASLRRLQFVPNFPHDFRTPEYEVYAEPPSYKWEAVRGLGQSFGNNRMEGDADMLSPDELVRMLVDVVSKGGNLLIGIAPDAMGVFPPSQTRRMLALGEWLGVHGEAIFDTTPWTRAAGASADGVPLRFTQRDGAVYAIALEAPRSARFVIEGLAPADGAEVHLLGRDGALDWERAAGGIAVDLPEGFDAAPAWALRIGLFD